MAHGENANKHRAREYWSPRHRGILSWGSIGKQLTHEKERMRDKKIIQDEMKNLDKEKDENLG
jgi:hypothetical protein